MVHYRQRSTPQSQPSATRTWDLARIADLPLPKSQSSKILK